MLYNNDAEVAATEKRGLINALSLKSVIPTQNTLQK
jgi:hypothetical protein